MLGLRTAAASSPYFWHVALARVFCIRDRRCSAGDSKGTVRWFVPAMPDRRVARGADFRADLQPRASGFPEMPVGIQRRNRLPRRYFVTTILLFASGTKLSLSHVLPCRLA